MAGSGNIHILIGAENQRAEMHDVGMARTAGRPGHWRGRGPRSDPDELLPAIGTVRFVSGLMNLNGSPLCLVTARAQERADEIDIEPRLLADIETLKGQAEASRIQAEERLTSPAGGARGVPQLRRRTAEERQRDLGLAAEDLIRKVLVLADDFDRAIEARPDAIASDPWFEASAPSIASCASSSRARA